MSAPTPTDAEPIVLVVLGVANGAAKVMWATLREVADAACADPAVARCVTSARADSGPPTTASGLGGIAVMSLPATGTASLLDRVAPIIDPDHDAVLEAREHRIASYERDWALGSQTPGERMVSLVRRKPSLTRDEFATYWRDVHAPIAMSFTILPWAYTQYVITRTLFGRPDEPDGVFMMHFRTAQDRQSRWADHPDEAARGAADAAVFMDTTVMSGTMMQETIWREQ